MQYSGTPGDDPTDAWWHHGNYVGPHWSDGKNQESVEFGEADPIDELDSLARDHDSAYARFKDDSHRRAADMIFAEKARLLNQDGQFAGNPQVAANAVEYGNHALSKLKTGVSDASKFGFSLPGIAYAIGHMLYNNLDQEVKLLNGTYLKKEREEVERYLATDPRKRNEQVQAVKLPRESTAPIIDRAQKAVGEPKASWFSRVKRDLRPVGTNSIVPADPQKDAALDTRLGPHSNLLWPSKQAKRLKRFIALRDAAHTPNAKLHEINKPKKKKQREHLMKVLPEATKKKVREQRRAADLSDEIEELEQQLAKLHFLQRVKEDHTKRQIKRNAVGPA